MLNGLFDIFEVENEPGADPAAKRRVPVPVWQKVFGQWELAPIITLGSGRPFNLVTAEDANRTHAFPPASRPPGAPRNSLRSPTTFNVDLRLVKYLTVGSRGKLDLELSVFNLFNHGNVLAINPVAGRDGMPILRSTGREMQLSIDFEF